LTLSLKFFDALYVHKDILEGEKSHDMNSLAELGRTLKIGEEIFENIDKVSILNSNIRWLYPLDVSIFCMVLSYLGSDNQFITPFPLLVCVFMSCRAMSHDIKVRDSGVMVFDIMI
jgi:hypothetical protein